MAMSIRYGEQSVAHARLSGDPALVSKSLMSLAGSAALSGDNVRAIRTLDEAMLGADPYLRAEIEFQRGATIGRMGNAVGALACYSAALPVFEHEADRESQAMTLHNRAMVQISLGRLDDAEYDLLRARPMGEALGSGFLVAGVDHGLGVVAALRGDIPRALENLEESKRRFTEVVGNAFESQVSRCEVLTSAGLFREAMRLSRATSSEMKKAGLAEDEAEARLAGAHAALLAGSLEQAVNEADRATEMFIAQGRETWTASAQLIAIQGRYQKGTADIGMLSGARRAAEVLESQGHLLGMVRARLLAGLIGSHSDIGDRGVSDLAWVAEHARGPIETRLQGSLAAAVLGLTRGDSRRADAAARAGMRLLDDFQAALGATDIRVGVERHGRELGSLGLRLALEARDPRRCFRWMEARRGRALAHRPVIPPGDEALAAEMAELRYVAAELRHADGEEALKLVRRQRSLQAAVRDRARVAKGREQVKRHPGPAAISVALEDATLIEMSALEGVLWVVAVHRNRFRLVQLGSASEVMREYESLRFAMRRLARGRGSVATAQQVADRLDAFLFGPLRIHDGPLVIVPTPGLYALPWRALPTCRNRPVTISPSAELWYRARESLPSGSGVIIAAGPDLDLSDAEARAVARLYPGSRLLSSTRATVQKVQGLLDGASIAHLASHAFFQFENPMFSSLRLTDGDLNVYDIERLETAPDMVVLSACDSGFSDTHSGEELMGLSSALLSMGTGSIIASVGLVPDSHATKDLMVALHRSLVAGLSPSDALHEAQAQVGETPEGFIAASSFICIGAG
jgi:tetratricopeptide (TPR) repeat protein